MVGVVPNVHATHQSCPACVHCHGYPSGRALLTSPRPQTTEACPALALSQAVPLSRDLSFQGLDTTESSVAAQFQGLNLLS